MKIFNLLETQYYNFTQNVKNYLSRVLSENESSFGNNTIFGQLINVLGNVVQNIMLYIEDSLVEQNKYTAQRKKSIYGLASLSGYNPSYGKAAGVQLKLSFIPSNYIKSNIILNNKENITCTQNGLQYNIILPQEAIILSVDNDNSDKFLYAVQGKFESQRFISTGGKYYTQNFNFVGNMDIEYLEVKINNEIWEKCDSFYDMTADAQQYTYKVSNISGIDIIFGNDKYGRSLHDGDVIEINYLVHDGEYGNLNPENNIYFVFNNILMDVNGNEFDGNNMFNLVLASNDSITSGSNSESIDQVKQMIGLNSRSLVLASPENYKNFLSKFSFCGYNRTWSERGSLYVNSLIIKNYKQLVNKGLDYFNLKENDFILTDSQKDSIKNCLNNSGCQLAGVTYNIFNPELCKYAMYIYVSPKSNKYDKQFITNKIRNLIGEFFCNINNDIFIPKSDIIHLLKTNIDEIDSVDIYILSEQNEKALITKQYKEDHYEYDAYTGLYKIYSETVYLYDNVNPNLGLDSHGNIYLQSNHKYPILMGGWDYMNSDGTLVTITDPLIITFE